jgi:cardiolipin synthase
MLNVQSSKISNAQSSKPWRALNWPNRISLLRLVLVAPFLVLVMNQDSWGPSARYWAIAIFALMAASDILDGQLARRLGQRTRLGAILDPLADKILIICSVVLLSMPQYVTNNDYKIPNWVVVAVVGKDLWVTIGFMVTYLVTDRFLIHATVFGKISTIGQVALVLAVITAPDFDVLHHDLGKWMAHILDYVVAALSIAAVVSYTRLGLRFIAQGQQPLDDSGVK